MTDLIRFEFEGSPIDVIHFRGRRVWIAKQVGAALGYAKDGARLAERITKEWAEELDEGEDYEVLRGRDLSDFKEIGRLTTESVVSRTPQLTVLYTSGMSIVFQLSRMPRCRPMRKWFGRVVFPQLASTGRYEPDPERAKKMAVLEQLHDRVMMNQIPDGYFSVFQEGIHLIIRAAQHGLVPDARTITDISIGHHFSRYWKENGLTGKYGQRSRFPHCYPHYFPQRSVVQAFIYPEAAWPEYRQWLRSVYIPDKLPRYLARKVKQGLLTEKEASDFALSAVKHPLLTGSAAVLQLLGGKRRSNG
jgi:prophage antirepressor-like protein